MKKLTAALIMSASLGLAGCDAIDRLPESWKALIASWTGYGIDIIKTGKFVGNLRIEFLETTSGDGQDVSLFMLLEPFGYIDGEGVEWNVPEGYFSNGASIPTPLWTVIGGPLTGPYRKAAVIHDYFCETQDRPWEQVHEMFREAAYASGTDYKTANLLYAGVRAFGPRWEPRQAAVVPASATGFRLLKAQTTPTPGTASEDPNGPPSIEGKSNVEIFRDLKFWIETKQPTKAEIDSRVEEIRALLKERRN